MHRTTKVREHQTQVHRTQESRIAVDVVEIQAEAHERVERAQTHGLGVTTGRLGRHLVCKLVEKVREAVEDAGHQRQLVVFALGLLVELAQVAIGEHVGVRLHEVGMQLGEQAEAANTQKSVSIFLFIVLSQTYEE